MTWTTQAASGDAWTVVETAEGMFDADIFDLDMFDASYGFTAQDAGGDDFTTQTQNDGSWVVTGTPGSTWN